MDTQNNNSAKFAFFYMLSLVALLFMAISSGMIIFQIINKSIVDVISNYRGSYSPDQLKFAISALIISAPIYYITMRQICKNLFSGALDKDSGIRKWMTYFIILVSSVVMIGWLISTINSFLGGELTIKFILKATTAIVIALSVFTFYLYDIKRKQTVDQKNKIVSIYFYGSLIVVIAVFVSALFFVESPKDTRNRKLDEAILSKFSRIDNSVNDYYRNHKKLPENLEMLLNDANYYIARKDIQNPATKKQFEYKIVDSNKYELCANFMSSNKSVDEFNKYNSYNKNRWSHDAGYQCISQEVRDIVSPRLELEGPMQTAD